MRVTPSMSPAISREKGSGTAMEPSRFSTPSRVCSPVRGGVTASKAGGLFLRLPPNSLWTESSFIACFFSFSVSARGACSCSAVSFP